MDRQNAQIIGTKFGIILTICSLGISIVDYYLWRSSPVLLSQISGIIITFSYIYNVLYLAFIGYHLDKNEAINSSINSILNFLLLLGVVTGVGFFLLAIGVVWGLFTFWGFQFFVFIIQYRIYLYIFKKRTNRGESEINLFRPNGLVEIIKKIAKPIMKLLNPLLVLLLFLIYLCGGILVHAQITGGDKILGQVTGAACGITSGFIILWIISISSYTNQYFNVKTKPILFRSLIILSVIMFSVFLLPVVSKPNIIKDGNSQFETIFGSEWNNIPESITSYTLKVPFVDSQFYYGYSNDRLADPQYYYYEESLNNLYFNNSEYQLYYDVRYPKVGYAGSNSIGKNSTIILLHSGGWNSGDKSVDAVQVQKHLASQGYIVYDIQYRLLDSGLMDTSSEFGFDMGWVSPAPTQYNNLHGNYSIRDMVFDFGTFTKYLASLSESDRFGANLSSVIILGVSAGGHVAAICTYGYHHPYFAGNFSDALTIKAAVFYNPPNDAEYFFYQGHPMYYPYLIRGSPEEVPDHYYYYTPSNLITKDSVPTILFHGTIDKMVPPENSDQIYTSLKNHDVTSVLIKGPYGGHGFDFGPSFSPITTYYLERFLYQVC